MSRLDPSASRIVLRPRFFDRLYVVLLVAAGLGGLAFPVVFLIAGSQPHIETVHCDRASDTCTYSFPSLFGNDTYTNRLTTWTSSKAIEERDHSVSWKVERATTPLWLGTRTTDPALVAIYRAQAGELQVFLADPTRTTFDEHFEIPRSGSPAGIVLVGLLGLILAYYGFRWWRGWYAELEFAGDDVIIRRRPMFFTGPRELRMPRAELRLVEAVEKRYLGKGQSAKFARFELQTRDGKRVFRYTTMYDGKSRAVLDGYMQLLANHVSSR